MNKTILILCALILSAMAVVPQTHGGGTPTVLVAPSFVPGVSANKQFQISISVSNMPLFDGFDIAVKVDPTQLSPVSISINSGMLPGFDEFTNCVNGGIHHLPGTPGNLNCRPTDGPGIAHEVALSSFFVSGNVPLFNIVYVPVKHAGGPGTVIDIYDDLIFNGSPIPVAHITLSGFYSSPTLPDFSIAASPFSSKIPQGRTGTVNVSITSVNGFAGTLGVNTDTSYPHVPVFLSSSSLTLAPNGAETVVVTISPTASTALGSYNLVVNATGGNPNLIHSVAVGITVTQQSFTLTTSIQFPTSLIVPQGSSNSTTITLTSINTFAGIVTLSAFVLPSSATGVSFALSNSTFTGKSVEVLLSPDATAAATLSVFATASTLPGVYNVPVSGISGGLRFSTFVPVTVVPGGGKHHGHLVNSFNLPGLFSMVGSPGHSFELAVLHNLLAASVLFHASNVTTDKQTVAVKTY